MDANLKAKWVEALRSDEYQQGRSALFENGKFCCLGVLCEISGKGRWSHYSDTASTYFYGDEDRGRGYMPMTLRDEIGLNGAIESHVANMNDDGHTFAEIADYIEANL